MSARDRRRPGGAKKRRQSESQRIARTILDAINRAPATDGASRDNDEEFPRLRPGLFRTTTNEGWARILVGDHVECHAIQSTAFMLMMARESYAQSGDVPRSSDLKDGIRAVDAEARFGSVTEEVSLRVAGGQKKIIIDLGDDRWRAVAVTAEGFRLLQYHPTNFRRPAAMLSLPEPDLGQGDLTPLRALHPSLADDDRWALVSSWMVNCFRPWGSYGVLSLTGEAGSGKTSLARTIMSIVDPAETQLRSPPRTQRDVTAASRNARVLCFDNISVIPIWLSDCLCRLATRVADAERRYYTNSEEHFVRVGAPTLLTSIPEVVGAEDLVDRTLSVSLRQLADRDRISDADLARWGEREGPGVFAGVLTALSTGLRRVAEVVPTDKTRLLDHLEWSLACAPALRLSEEAVTSAHVANRDNIAADSVFDSPVGAAVVALSDKTLKWEGIARDLLVDLTGCVPATERRDGDWPRTARGLAGALRRLQPSLRRMGILVSFVRRGHGHRRVITIERADPTDRPHRPHRPAPTK